MGDRKMIKEELEIDNKRLDFNEKVQFVVKQEELKEQDIRMNKLGFDYQERENDYCLLYDIASKRIADLEKKNEQAIKILRNIVYMSNTGLSSKNELAFARLIGEAEQFLQNIYTKNKSSDEGKNLKVTG